MHSSEERMSYEDLKSASLEAFFDFCRDSGVVKRQPYSQVFGRVIYEYEYGFERPLEDVMWRVILLVLSGGWLPEWEAGARERLKRQLEGIDLDSLLADIPASEADLFLHDLKILGLWPRQDGLGAQH